MARDPATDSALIETADPVTDKPLSLPPIGSSVGVLGFPLATSELRFTEGTVSGLNEEVDYEDVTVRALVTDSAINPGNSGGPVLDVNGSVIGLVSGQRLWVSGEEELRPASGQGYVIRADDLMGGPARWKDLPATDPESCGGDEPVEEPEPFPLVVASDDPQARDIARSLVLHGVAINVASYEAAWQLFTLRMQQAMVSLDRWSAGTDTSFWRALTIESVSTAGLTATVEVELTTSQASEYGRGGQTCSEWRLTYAMVNVDGGWLIDKAANALGSPTEGSPLVCDPP